MKLSLTKRKVFTVMAAILLIIGLTYITSSSGQIQASVTTTDIALSYNGKFVSVKDNAVTVGADQYFYDELLELQTNDNTNFTIRSKQSGQYLSYAGADASNGYRIKAITTSAPGNTEKFKQIANQDGTVSYQTASHVNGALRYMELSSGSEFLRVSSTMLREKAKLNQSNLTLRPTVQVLEITDNGTSDLAPLLGGTPFVTLTTYSMKQFVASREQLDGRYDAVYIGRGKYRMNLLSTSGNNNQSSHNTSGLQNDMTQLKASELITNFVDKGLPVILYSDSGLKEGVEYQADVAGKKGLLKLNFAKYNQNGNRRDNVYFISESHLAARDAFVGKVNLLERGNLRPQLTLLEKPVVYTAASTHQYKAGDQLVFKYAVDNAGDLNVRDVYLNLYIGMDSSIPFKAEQLVATQKVTAKNGTLQIRLPRGFSGLQYWKLELTDFNSPLKDIQTGVYRFQDEKINIRVLQVMPNNNSDSNLTNSNNIQSAYLNPASGKTKDAYTIQIDPVTITAFNNDGYKELNGKYDMLIFGFTDEYNKFAPINNAATDAVLTFINTGQSVMFTHDTIYYSSNSDSQNWINKFQTVTGQIAPRTDMGISAPATSTVTRKVNTGLLTHYPFFLSDSTKVATTHNQYFTLDLEDPSIIPWYNMDGSGRTIGDSWNHYYTYSKGNVTYSGSGHTNKNFPDWEQQLFVNTMYRAYMGSNHAPILTVHSPIEYKEADNNFIPSYSDILISYKPEDFDLNDRELFTSVNLKYDGRTIPLTTNDKVFSGSTINHTLPNPLPNGGDLLVEITARDKQGAEVRKEIKVKVVKIESHLELGRRVSDNVVDNKVATHASVEFNYTITPKDIDKNDALQADRMRITDVTFSEKFPPNLDIGSLPQGFSKSGSLKDGYTVTGQIANIEYALTGNKYSAAPISFVITVVPKEDKTVYPLLNAKLDYKDIGGITSKTVQFPFYTFESLTKVRELAISDRMILIGDRQPMLPKFTPETASNQQLVWSSNRPDLVTVDSSGIVTGIAAGTATLTATTTDGSQITAQAKVTVITPGLNITGPDQAAVGDGLTLGSSLITADYEQIVSYQWSVGAGASLNGTSSNSTTATGTQAGKSIISLTVTTNQKNAQGNPRTYSATKEITFFTKLQSLSLQGASLVHGDSKQLTPHVQPADASNKSVNWSSSHPDIVTVNNNGVVTGVGVGQSTITIASVDGSGLSTTAIVTVSLPKPVISGLDLVDLGGQITLNADIPVAANDPIASDGGITWEIAEGSANGQLSSSGGDGRATNLKGIRYGKVKVIVKVKTRNGRTYQSDPFDVNVEPLELHLYDTLTINPGDEVDLWNMLRSRPEAGKNRIRPTLDWRSSNRDIVIVDEATGMIQGLKPGSATITVTYRHDPSVTARITIIVRRPDDPSPSPSPETPGTSGTGRY